jgi:GGDEF domain-containing protein
MTETKIGTWKKSWVPRLWKIWSSIAGFVFTIATALIGLTTQEKIPINPKIVEWLQQTPPWPLWWLLFPAILLALAVSALIISLMQIWDNRRIAEGEAQLKDYAGERANTERELQRKRLELENLEGVFRERERMRRLDHITGIPNYLSWKDDLKNWDSRNEKELCMILIDLDKLKWLNSRSRECADRVLRYFAQNTYNSMRRDEQIHKANAESTQTIDGAVSYGTAEMYRHYQGGDEFFFIISGNVYGAIGFINRLAERVRSYESDIRETILRRYLKDGDIAAFRLYFAGAIIPHNEPETALMNAYEILDRAKESTTTRLLVVFDSIYEEPSAQRERLEKRREGARRRIRELDQKVRSGDEDSAARQQELLSQERELDININMLLKAERLFAVQ